MHGDAQYRQKTDPPYVHLAIVDRWTGESLLAGRKRVETRFSRSRRAPFGRVRRGDIVLFKVSSGKLLCTSVVKRVQHYERLDAGKIGQIRRQHGKLICASAAYWRERRDCRYGSLIWLGRRGPPPESFQPPRQYGNGWVVLGPKSRIRFGHGISADHGQ
jgi:hypothetical protein